MAINYETLANRRPDVVAYINQYHPEWTLGEIFGTWWTFDRAQVPQVAPDPVRPPPPGHDDSASFPDLVSYALFKGAVNTGTIPTGKDRPGVTSGVSPGTMPPGAVVPPAPVPPVEGSGFTLGDTIGRFYRTDPLGATVAFGLLGWIGFRFFFADRS